MTPDPAAPAHLLQLCLRGDAIPIVLALAAWGEHVTRKKQEQALTHAQPDHLEDIDTAGFEHGAIGTQFAHH